MTAPHPEQAKRVEGRAIPMRTIMPAKKLPRSRREPELATIRAVLRHAVRKFTAAKLAFGHGTDNARDEAAFLILEGLHLPIDRLPPLLERKLTDDERRRLGVLSGAGVAPRNPAAYLLGRAYVGGVPFHVDERVIVPRSF